MKTFTKLLSATLCCLAWSAQTCAVSLGELSVTSHLGQRLSGTITVDGEGVKNLEASCFKLIRPNSAADLPWLSRGNINFRREPTGGVLLLTSSESLDEPLLGLAIRIDCGFDLEREYVLMLSPAVFLANRNETPAQAMPTEPPAPAARKPARKSPAKPSRHTWIIGRGESVASLANALYPRDRAMRKAFSRAVYQANPDLAMDYAGHDRLPEGLVLEVPDLRQLANMAKQQAREAPIVRATAEPAPSSRNKTQQAATAPDKVPADKLVISGAPVATSYPGDRVLHAQLDATQAEVQRLDAFVANNLQQGEQPSDDPRILALQTRLVALQLALEKMRAIEAAGSLPVAAPPNPPEASAANVAQPVAASPAAVAVAEAAPASPAQPIQTAASATPPKPASDHSIWWLGGLVGVGGLFLGLLLGRQSGGWTRNPSPTQPGRLSWLSHEPVLGARREAAPDSAGLRSVGPVRNVPTLPQAEEFDLASDPLASTDLADFLLSTGHRESAAAILREFVETAPERALTPWVKLLMSYQQLGKRAEFEWVAQQLRRHFNVAELAWNDQPEALLRSLTSGGNDETGIRSIEDIPHLRTMISSLWGTPECYVYLEHLLRDNRGGQREGLPLPVIQEVVFLMQLLQDEAHLGRRII